MGKLGSLWRGIRRRSDVEAEMTEEFRLHLELRAADLVRSGLSPAEAARRARLEFGHTESHKQEARASRGLSRVDELRASWLDVKLGFRMLVKYPGLTLVGGLGMAVAVAIGAGFFAIMTGIFSGLPLDEGERVVAIETWDTEVNDQERRVLHDFVTWRDEMESVQNLGAFRDIQRNLVPPDGPAEEVAVAEMTAAGFRVARVPPLLGRPLIEEDEREGAPPVVVIGHDVWRTRFASDPAVVGRSVRFGNTLHRVVGVMPDGFAFPVNHRFWVPLRADPADYERRQGPGITVFGRLAPGATLDRAQAELMTIGLRAAAAFPETHERLRRRIIPYTDAFNASDEIWLFRLVQLLITMLLVVICVNVAILVYARTATRQGEIAVRSALGASRGRIVGQLFVEALVLSIGAAAVGLVVAGVTLGQAEFFIGWDPGGAPFWMHFGLSTGTVVYVLVLTATAGVIVGVVPAVKATGRGVRTSLQRLAVGSSGMQLGRTWTVLIVAQIAFAVAVLPTALFYAGEFIQYGTAEPGFAVEEFLTARLAMDREIPPSAEAETYTREFRARFAARQAELARRLEAEPGVSDVIMMLGVPGEEPTVWIEVDGVPTPAEPDPKVRSGRAGHRVGIGRVAVDFFDAFHVPILAGRRFQPGDLDAAASAVVVNQSFVERVLGGGNALGRRVRYVGRGGDADPEDVELLRWYQIVGVVGDFPNPVDPDVARARLYHPVTPGAAYPVRVALRVGGRAPGTFAWRLREITTALDPTLRLHEIRPLDEVIREEQKALRSGALGLALVTLSVLLLSAAGIYALMSFTVAQRRREIGIRSALGADPHRLLGNVFSRALRQLVIGVVVGAVAAPVMLTVDDPMDGKKAVVLLAVSALMIVVGLLAAIGPARRGL